MGIVWAPHAIELGVHSTLLALASVGNGKWLEQSLNTYPEVAWEMAWILMAPEFATLLSVSQQPYRVSFSGKH